MGSANEFDATPVVLALSAILTVAIALVCLVGWVLLTAWRIGTGRDVPSFRVPVVLVASISSVGLPYWVWAYGWSRAGVTKLALGAGLGWLGTITLLVRGRRRVEGASVEAAADVGTH